MSINLECKKYSGQGSKEGKYTNIKDAYKECPLVFKNFQLDKMIGKGGNGSVYLATAEYEGVTFPLCIKVAIFKTETDLDYSNKEVDLSYKMFINGVGPALLGANYVRINDRDGNLKYIQQHIYLEAFDSSCHIFFKSFFRRANDIEYKNMLIKTFNILDKQISTGLICADQKPENYVARESDGVVRMIDFGGKFCIDLTDDNKKHLILGVYFIYYITTISMFIASINANPRLAGLFIRITNQEFKKKGIYEKNKKIAESFIYIKNTPSIQQVLHTLDHYVRHLLNVRLTNLLSQQSHTVDDRQIKPYIKSIFEKLNIL